MSVINTVSCIVLHYFNMLGEIMLQAKADYYFSMDH